jgi:hypothetical protein
MEQTIYTLPLITEGTTEKVLKFLMRLKSIYSKNFGFIEPKNILKKKILYNDITFGIKISSCSPFQSCLYRLFCTK